MLLPQLPRLREQLAAIHRDALADAELLTTTLDSTGSALDVPREICRRALEQEMWSAALDARIAELKRRRAQFDAEAEACRTTARDGMEALGLKRLEDAELTATVGAGPASVVITDLNALPDDFKRIKIEPDKIALGRALKAGQRITGAQLSNGATVLTLRRS